MCEQNKKGTLDKLEYWNNYYSKAIVSDAPSLFAQATIKQLVKGKSIVDVGCGNGRDSVFFMQNGLEVYAVDLSHTAINTLEEKYGDKINLFEDDFAQMLAEFTDKFDYLYSRFTLHAITFLDQQKVIKNAFDALKKGGKFFIEVRCEQDDLFGKGELVEKDTYFYDGHTRRFVHQNELEEQLRQNGFDIEYSQQSKGFAPHMDADPIVLRITANKL